MPTLIQPYYNAIRDKDTAHSLAKVFNETHPVLSAVTQPTSRTTGVTVATRAGAITTNNTSLAAETAAAFVVTCPTVSIGDVILVCIRSGAVGGMTSVEVVGVANGSFTLSVMNGNAAAGAAETGAIVINYAVIQAR